MDIRPYYRYVFRGINESADIYAVSCLLEMTLDLAVQSSYLQWHSFLSCSKAVC